MKTQNEKPKKKIDEKQKSTVFTVFTLLFPSLMTAGIAALNSQIGWSIMSVALFFYQAALLKRYVETQQG